MSSITFTPTSASQSGSSPQQPWSNITGVESGGTGTFADVSVVASQSSYVATGSGSNPNQLPGGATIVGLEIGAQVWATATGAVITSFGGTLGSKTSTDTSVNGSTITTTAGATITLGSPTTFPTGMAGITAADVNNGTFSVSLQVNDTGTIGEQVNANNFAITVFYTLAPNQIMPRPVVIPAAYPHWLRD